MEEMEEIEEKENEEKLVSIIIPTHNRKSKLLRLINSIYNSSFKNLEIIVVDDGSTDNTYETVKHKFPKVKIIRKDVENFSSISKNIGIRDARGYYLFLIDDDNVIDKYCISELVKAMEKDKNIGVAAPLMFYLSSPDKIWSSGSQLNYLLYPKKDLLAGKLDSPDLYTKIFKNIDFFPNAQMIKKKEDIIFDSDKFPHNWAEVDFCLRIKNKGAKLETIPQSKIWHDVDRSGILTKFGEFKTYDQARSRIIFRKLYGNFLQMSIFWILLFPISSLYYFYKIIMSDERNKFILLKYFVRGSVDGIKQK